jgi:hypothetical protein
VRRKLFDNVSEVWCLRMTLINRTDVHEKFKRINVGMMLFNLFNIRALIVCVYCIPARALIILNVKTDIVLHC